jgi:uncharacterized membrane protein
MGNGGVKLRIGPLISCGTVPPRGWVHLMNPEQTRGILGDFKIIILLLLLLIIIIIIIILILIITLTCCLHRSNCSCDTRL